MFGILVDGTALQVWYLTVAIVSLAIAMGLILLKRWAFIIFIAEQIFFAIMFLFNIVVIEKSDFLNAGRPDSHNFLVGHRVLMVSGIIICFILVGWILKYRNYYKLSS
jgi:hypothetical protein